MTVSLSKALTCFQYYSIAFILSTKLLQKKHFCSHPRGRNIFNPKIRADGALQWCLTTCLVEITPTMPWVHDALQP